MNIHAVLKKVDDGHYTEALEMIQALLPEIQNKGRVMIAKADCFYELQDDLGALKQYGDYLEKYPSGRGRNFALMGMVCCLRNLEMTNDAKSLLQLMDDAHPGKKDELIETINLLEKQNVALDILQGIFSRP